MSRFSEKCKEIMLENGTNVYRLSTTSSLERTTLQRMVTGKRLPNIDFFKRFCHELRMPLAERKELTELYKAEMLGESVYQSRKCIKNLLQMLGTLDSGSETESAFYFTPHKNSTISANFTHSTASDVELKIISLLNVFFSSSIDPAYIYTNLPANDGSFFHMLEIMHKQYPDKVYTIQHLIHFHMNTSSAPYNLNILASILPWALSSTTDYTPWYYYSRLQEHDFTQLLFPYFIITPEQVLLISGDLTQAVMHQDSTTIKIYMQEYEKIRSLSAPLFHARSTQKLH